VAGVRRPRVCGLERSLARFAAALRSTVPKGTAPIYRLITDTRFANKLYSDWGTLIRCDFYFSIDISDAYHSLGASRGPGQPNEVTWIYALVNGCKPSTYVPR
jgi:hypothetical protein